MGFFFFQARILESVATVLLQGIFLTRGSKLSPLCLLHCRRILYLLNHQGSPHFSINLKLRQHFKSTVLLFKKLPTCFKRIFNDASLLPEHIFIGKVVLVQLLSHVRLFATPWTVAYQASPSPGACSNSCPLSR